MKQAVTTFYRFTSKIGSLPFVLSLSKGRSWFDKLTTNGIWHIYFHDSLVGNRS
jgi:hypothetical protein